VAWSTETDIRARGLVEPVASPALFKCAKGHSASHMLANNTTPEVAAIRTATPAITATPMLSKPSMNSQSVNGAPAMAWNCDWNGPAATPLRGQGPPSLCMPSSPMGSR